MSKSTGIAGATEYQPASAYKGQFCYICNHEFDDNGSFRATALPGTGVIQFCPKPECWEAFQKDQAEELVTLQTLFSMRWNADMRAIKMWQEAAPGRDLTWPDHTDLLVWLLGELDKRKASG